MDRMSSDVFAEETGAGARRKVEEFMSSVKDQASKIKKKSFEDLWTGTVDYIKDNPGKTILVSVAIGLVIGGMLRRRGE